METPKPSLDQLVDNLAAAFDQARQGRNPSREDVERLVVGLVENAAARVTVSAAERRPPRRTETPRGGNPEGT